MNVLQLVSVIVGVVLLVVLVGGIVAKIIQETDPALLKWVVLPTAGAVGVVALAVFLIAYGAGEFK